MTSRMLKVTKWSSKAALFGGTIYLVTASGVWSDNAEVSKKTLQGLQRTTDQTLGHNVLSQVELNVPTLNLAEKWNYGVATSLGYVADIPNKFASKCSKGISYVSSKVK